VLLQKLKKNNNIIDVDFCKSLIRTKQTIDLSLHIDEKILVFYNNNIKEFLFAIKYYCQFVTICKIYLLLIKESKAINNNNKRTFLYCKDNFSLQKKQINV